MPPHGMEVDLTVQKMIFGFDSITSACDSLIEFLQKQKNDTVICVTRLPFVCVYMWTSLNTGLFFVSQPAVSPLPALQRLQRV